MANRFYVGGGSEVYGGAKADSNLRSKERGLRHCRLECVLTLLWKVVCRRHGRSHRCIPRTPTVIEYDIRIGGKCPTKIPILTPVLGFGLFVLLEWGLFANNSSRSRDRSTRFGRTSNNKWFQKINVLPLLWGSGRWGRSLWCRSIIWADKLAGGRKV